MLFINARYKKCRIFLYGFSVSILFSLLSGCAAVPLQRSSVYSQVLYRRIPYKEDGRYRVVDMFYATDRKIQQRKDSSLLFRPEIGQNISYGTINIGIDPNITIGKVVPSKLKGSGTIGVQKNQLLEEDIFIKQLDEAVKASPHHSLLVLVFGFKDNFEFTAIKAGYFMYLLDVNTPVLLFDWPGDQHSTIFGYERARRFADVSGPYLGDLLAKIIREVKPEKLWVEASSLGCQVVCRAFDQMCKYPDLSDPEEEIDHVVLTAPDVGQNDFDTRFKDELASLSKKLTTYVSSDDGALLISGLIDGQRKLGRQRLKVQEQTEEAKDILYLKSMDPGRITLIDVTPINKASFKHGYYLESPEFYDDFYMRIFDREPIANRHLYLLKVENGTDYWVLRGDK